METLYQIAERHKLPRPKFMKEPKTENHYGIEANAYNQIRKLYKLSELGQKYQPISLEFLGLKDEKGFPKFAVYGLEKSRCNISIKSSTYDSFGGGVKISDSDDSSVPAFCYGHMKKTIKEMREKHLHPKLRGIFGLKSGVEARMSLSQEFMSVIPQETKEKIEKTKEEDGFSFAIISESAGWVVDETVRQLPKNPDPLVIGYSYAANQTYLIDTFDMTSMEQWIAKEFTE